MSLNDSYDDIEDILEEEVAQNNDFDESNLDLESLDALDDFSDIELEKDNPDEGQEEDPLEGEEQD